MPYATLGLGFKYTIDPNANPLICEASLGLTVQTAQYVPFRQVTQVGPTERDRSIHPYSFF